MREEEFISLLSKDTDTETGLERMRSGVPLGLDSTEHIVFSQTRDRVTTFRHTCVTGNKRTVFIRRLLLTLTCLYGKEEANFFILSTRKEYGELMRLTGADITVPFLRDKTDLAQATKCLQELITMYKTGKGYPKLVLVLDGLEELEGCNKNSDLEEYREIFDMLMRVENVEVITGVELMQSIFSGYPGAFVGVGNCLVTLREEGKADVTYVGDDSSLSMPTPMHYPDSPSVTETVILLNSLPKDTL